jgi:histone deacetylase 11
MIPIVYSPRYNVTAWGLERLHPFDSRKYGRIRDALIARGLRRRGDFVTPKPVSRNELLKVHSPPYLRSLQSSEVLAGILEVPQLSKLPGWVLNWRVLRPMRLAVGGTVLACRLALERGLAINLGGGFHHAGGEWGSGFCVYADIPLASWVLHDEKRVGKVLVVDLDAHQGNGTAHLFSRWPWAAILDLYENDLFPISKEPEDYPVPLPADLGGAEYLGWLQQFLPEALRAARPNLVIYNAGSDPFADDPLARLRLSATDLAERDLYVVSQVRERGIPLAMVLSGGYSRESWRLHADSIEGILKGFDATV